MLCGKGASPAEQLTALPRTWSVPAMNFATSVMKCESRQYTTHKDQPSFLWGAQKRQVSTAIG
jgi:hypothetical protein